jgi:hypothetical protein
LRDAEQIGLCFFASPSRRNRDKQLAGAARLPNVFIRVWAIDAILDQILVRRGSSLEEIRPTYSIRLTGVITNATRDGLKFIGRQSSHQSSS